MASRMKSQSRARRCRLEKIFAKKSNLYELLATPAHHRGSKLKIIGSRTCHTGRGASGVTWGEDDVCNTVRPLGP